MDEIDKKIINISQKDFPLCQRPFETLGLKINICEDEILKRIKKLKLEGVIRRIGASFNSRKIGYKSTLCAMIVEDEKIDDTVSVINSYPQVTHNYLREHNYNLWFTIIAKSHEELDDILEYIKMRTSNTSLINLPAVCVFKIDTNFKIDEE